MTTEQKEKLIASLEKHGFPPEEIEKILKGFQQIDDGEGISAEDVYKKLYAKMKVHA